MLTAITNATVFDGQDVLDARTVVLEDRLVVQVGGPVPRGADTVDAASGTLLPGLIDAHAHTSEAFLRTALAFGVTTELEMGGFSSRADRDRWSAQDDLADVRSAGRPLTAPRGYPTPLFAARDSSAGHGHDHGDGGGQAPGSGGHHAPRPEDFPQTATAEQARALVHELATSGSDYIKLILEEGTVAGCPGLPELSSDAYAAGVAAAHAAGLMALTHAQTLATAERGVRAGTDGLVHLFIDQPHTPELVELVRASGAFVTPCLTLVSSMMGHPATGLAADPRVQDKLDPAWRSCLLGSMSTYPQGRFEDALASVAALLAAGVDVLAGTDVSVPAPNVAGLAHGASLHHELQLLVMAGLSPAQALRAATSLPAARFGLTDRGRIAEGLRADLVLVEGDPTARIGDTLSVTDVWRHGRRSRP